MPGHRRLRWSFALLPVIALAACGHDSRGSATKDVTREARVVETRVGYPLAWAGPRVGGLALTDITRDARSTTLIYGTCTASGESGCSPPLEIQTSSICDRNALLLDVRPTAASTARGVEVLNYGEGRFELATGTVNVVVFAASKLARRAIAALGPLGQPHRAMLRTPRYPRYYVAQLLRVHDAYARAHDLGAVRAALGISKSAARFELGLARQLGADRLKRGGRHAPALQDVKRAHEPAGLGASKQRPAGCALEPA